MKKTVLVLWIISLFLMGCGGTKTINADLKTPDFEYDTPVGEITKDTVVEQTFVSTMKEMDSFVLYGASYIRENEGEVIVKILNEQGISLQEWKIDAATVQDNTPITLDCRIMGTKGKTLTIQITSTDCEPDHSITFWATPQDDYPDGQLSIDGFKQYNDLWFQVNGK